MLVVDKPRGMTSHDVVARARRALRTRAVGHAGTLDPMATGVLVIAVGEATKLVPSLTADDKAYDATIQLGVATDSLDADGSETARAEVPTLSLAEVQAAADGFLGPHRQRAPAVSAIKVDGERLHAKARRGEVFEAPVRDVVLHAVDVRSVADARVELSLRCAKGFYVRSFGRDLAEALGTVGHLTALRRTSSGRFDLSTACQVEELDAARLLPLADAAQRVLPGLDLDEDQCRDVRCGRRIACAEPREVVGLYGGRVVAVLRPDPERPGFLRVARGFADVE